MLTFIKLTDKEAVQCPMAKGSVCACGGGGRRRGRRHRSRVLVISHFFFFNIAEGGLAGTEERKCKQTGGSRGAELQTFSGVRHLDMMEATRVSPTRPKVGQTLLLEQTPGPL